MHGDGRPWGPNLGLQNVLGQQVLYIVQNTVLHLFELGREDPLI